MLNIIPLEYKKGIMNEYRLRLAVVAMFAIAALVLASLILLVPSYFIANSKYNLAANDLAQVEKGQGQATQENDVNKQIRDVNKKIHLFQVDDVSSHMPADVILKVISLKGAAVQIAAFTYDQTPVRERIVIAGQARNRDSLAGFVDQLKKDPSFTKVDLPIGSYVKSTNIDFSITLERAIKGVPIQK